MAPIESPVTYYATSDIFLKGLRFVAYGADEPATDLRIRRAVQNVTGTFTAGTMFPATFQNMGDASNSTSETSAYDVGHDDVEFKKLSQIVAIDAVISRSAVADSILQAQIELAHQSLRWGLGQSLVNGNGSTLPGTGDLTGLAGVTGGSTPQAQLSFPSTVTFVDTADNERMFLRELFHLKTRATSSSGPVSSGPDAFVTSDRVIRRVVNAQFLQGATPEFRECPLVGGHVCHYLYGVPLLPAPVDETGDKADVYAVKLTGASGLKVAHLGGRPEDYGITVERLPKDPATGVMSAIVQGYYALIVPESHSVVKLDDVDIPSGTAAFPV